MEEEKARASFYPRSRIPGELLEKIESSLTMQRILFIPQKVLQSRDITTEKAKSRFNLKKQLVGLSQHNQVTDRQNSYVSPNQDVAYAWHPDSQMHEDSDNPHQFQIVDGIYMQDSVHSDDMSAKRMS